MRKARAFSLAELCVVVGIVALLIGLLMPVIGKVRGAAARVTCASRLADLGRAFQTYLSDNRGRVPKVNVLPRRMPPVIDAPSVLEVFAPFTKGSVGVWRCPGDSPVNVDSTFPPDAGSYFEAYGLSYEYNSWMNAFHGGGTFSDALAAAKLPPHLVPTDKFRIFNDFSHFHGKAGQPGNMNFLFADWHVGDIGSALGISDLKPG